MKKYYLSSHNSLHDVAGKHGFATRDDAVRAFHDVRKLNLKHMYYTLTHGHQTVILDSRHLVVKSV